MRLRLIVPLLVSAVLVGACGSLTAPAATVNGVDISEDELRDELEVAAEFSALNPGVVQGLDQQGGNYVRSSARGLLNERVTSEIFAEALDDLGGEVTEEERTRTGEAFAQLQSNEWLEIQFERQVTQQALVRVLTEEAGLPSDAEAWYELNGESLGLVCASHVLLSTEEDAVVARARVVDDGEDFAAVAMELSIGPTGPNGGDLGCSDPARFVPEFADALRTAEVGEITEPVESDFGWHVINVRARGADVPFADAAGLAEESFEAERGAVIGASINELLVEADVHVASRYGVWDGTQIVPEG
ncbi:MAG: peptidylprolyl isomerase [Actinomycetota bacterium]